MSNQKSPDWLGYIGAYTTQLYRDYNKPYSNYKDPYEPTSTMEMVCVYVFLCNHRSAMPNGWIPRSTYSVSSG